MLGCHIERIILAITHVNSFDHFQHNIMRYVTHFYLARASDSDKKDNGNYCRKICLQHTDTTSNFVIKQKQKNKKIYNLCWHYIIIYCTHFYSVNSKETNESVTRKNIHTHAIIVLLFFFIYLVNHDTICHWKFLTLYFNISYTILFSRLHRNEWKW